MELTGKRILLISPEPWDGLQMSKHHLSQALVARGNSVVYLDVPSTGAKGIVQRTEQGVVVVTYDHWFRGVNRLPKAVHMWYYRRLIRKVARATGGPFDIIWCFDTSRMQWFPEGMGFKLLHLADYDILYVGHGLIPTAELILTTCQVVADEVAPKASAPTVNVGHALDKRWYRGIDALAHRSARPPRNVVYAGTMAISYIDFDGYVEIAGRHPELQFTFIGSYDPDFPDPAFHVLRTMPNVRLTGLRTKDELIPMVRDADILLFGFRSATRAKERANPHKVLEYLSTGNVIVCSYTMEYEGRHGLLEMAAPGASLADRFDEALARYAELNAPGKRAARIDAVRHRSMDDLLDLINGSLHARS